MRLLLTSTILASAVCAQGTVTSTGGGTTFAVTSVPTSRTSTAGLSNFTANGTDSTYQHWWYYCIAGDTGGSAFNSSGGQLVQSYVGETARLNWANADGRGIRASWVLRVHDDAVGRGRANSHMTIENITAAPITVSVYAYTDIDLANTAGGDSATGATGAIGSMIHRLTDNASPDTLELFARTPDADEAAAFAVTRTKLLNQGGSCPTLGPAFATAGGAFGPGDYTGAFGWQSRTLRPGEILTMWVVLAHNSSTGRAPNATTANVCGVGTPGTNGLPQLVTSILPIICTGGEIEIRNGLANAVAVYNANTTATCQNIFGVSIAPTFPYLLSIPAVLNASGRNSLFAPIPCSGALVGLALTWQGLFIDAASPAAVPVSATNGVNWVLGG